MRKIIIQNYTSAHKELFDLTTNSTKKYATNNGFEYIVSDKVRCTGEKATQHLGWEKIAWLNEFLPTIEDGSLVVYADCDSIFLSGDLTKALDASYEMGMVKLRGGLGGKEIVSWFNTGVIVLINTSNVRDYLLKIWNMNEVNEEIAIKKESSSNSLIYSLNPEWNCWNNNQHLVSSPFIKTFHGMKYEDKLTAIKDFLKTVTV
jgi:hypothetical protein